MLLKIILTTFILHTISMAAFEKVRVGKIDAFYNNKIDRYELINIIEEIEYEFEQQLGTNVFDYSEDGKPIDLLYVSPSKLERNVKYKLEKLKKIESDIKNIKYDLPQEKENIEHLKEEFQEVNSFNNNKIKKFNNYIKKMNQRKSITRDEYNELQNYVKKKKSEFHNDKKELQKLQSKIKFYVKNFNKKINQYNRQINSYNRTMHEVESMSKSLKKIRGRTFGVEEIRYKTFIQNGQKVKEKSVIKSMNKIEIYSFDNKAQLKAILAHEIGHLIGMTHIRTKGALMNPMLQKNQENDLYLTSEDIDNFHENY